jgi:ABC-type glycerol-3-phosphate transport system permease component
MAEQTITQPIPSASRRTFGLQRLIPDTLKYLLLTSVLCLTFGPMLWVWLNSLRTAREIIRDPLGLPTQLVLENFANAWTAGNFGRYFINSIVVTAPVVIAVVLLSALGGYGLWRFKFLGNRVVFYTFLLGLMLPFQAIMIPLYYRLRDWDLLSTYGAAILPSTALGLPFGIFLMRAFFRGMAQELADAALVDGCNEYGVFWYVMLPLTRPAASALAVFQFMWTWNNFIIPYLYLQREELRTLPLGLMLFSGRYGTEYELLFAGITVATLPIVILYVIMQSKVIEGLTAGALKG